MRRLLKVVTEVVALMKTYFFNLMRGKNYIVEVGTNEKECFEDGNTFFTYVK